VEVKSAHLHGNGNNHSVYNLVVIPKTPLGDLIKESQNTN